MKKLPDSELELMMIIWHSQGPVTRMDIEAKLDKSRDILPNTVLSFLSRLEDKGFIKKEKQGKINYYSPLVDEDKYLQEEGKSIFKKMFGNSLSRFVTSLYDGNAIGEEDLTELRNMLDEMDDKKK
ncbi:Predicted transcriptional regulator [Hathewaya proteolytica DSM 3090]|uniref:Predicted transcriptional regulator n=1 Tax=Hathewaya proteolytica DSM 3090 TaxID=1121331 RepID=A0A1M6M2W9_9CLOT|nr:BlaI/MecI/CopY family transcriptional regulator [Hathewaya proteolytica]SHJ77799.1 Predicted transcriptional regulator [Hathewaya proteolytica DSM 3090]